MKLIYADAVKSMIYEKTPLKLFMKRTIEGAQRSMGELRSMIDELPAVDAKPVKHGRWISYPNCLAYDEHIACSNCKAAWNTMDNVVDEFNYCPNCGAKMDGGEE